MTVPNEPRLAREVKSNEKVKVFFFNYSMLRTRGIRSKVMAGPLQVTNEEIIIERWGRQHY